MGGDGQWTGRGGEHLPRALEALQDGRRLGLHRGAQLYVSRDFETVADLALGEVRDGEAMSPDHLLLWLSSSKPLTAVLVAQLWEAGLLELDDPVARHLPAFAQGGKEGVTVRHLLTHTAGVRMAPALLGWPATSWDEIVARVCGRKLEPGWVPGRKAGYHQMGSWFVLGELVRRLTGRPYVEVLREDLLEPLAMDDSWIGMPRERYRAYRDAGRLAPMYDTSGGRPAPLGWESEERVVPPSPAGNGHGPVRELGRFYEALLAGGRPPGGPPASRVLSPQAVAALTARHRTGLFDHTFRHTLDWGLGFILDSKQYGPETVPYAYGTRCSSRTFGHSGARSSTAFADPENRLVVALGTNGLAAPNAHQRRMRRVLDALYDDLGLAADDVTGDEVAGVGAATEDAA